MGACTRILDLFKSISFILKVAQLALGLLCLALVSGSVFIGWDAAKQQTIYATLYGFFILQIVVVLSFVRDYPTHRVIVLTIAVAAVPMYLVSGGLMIEVWHKRKSYFPLQKPSSKVLVAGIFSLINGIIYGVDIFLTFIKG